MGNFNLEDMAANCCVRSTDRFGLRMHCSLVRRVDLLEDDHMQVRTEHRRNIRLVEV